MRISKALAYVCFLAASSPAFAQNAATGSIDIVSVDMKNDAPTLTLSIIGTAKAKPDIATISAGVMTSSPNAADAMAQNNVAMTKLLAAIKAKGVVDKDIETSSISLGQDYDYSGEKGPVLKGYQASNSVSVRVRDIKKSGDIFDTLAKNGATNINGPSFSVENNAPLQEAARTDAMAKAAKQAAFYAKAAGYRMARLLAISENAEMGFIGNSYAKYEAAAEAGGLPPPPVQPSEANAAVSITVKYVLVK